MRPVAPRAAADRRRGFANPEWLILLFGLGILLAIVVPAIVRARDRHADLRRLAELRADVTAYSASHGGAKPAALQDAVPGPIDPPRQSKGHGYLGAGAVGPDTGDWGYDAASGRVWINCTHTDAQHKVWAEY